MALLISTRKFISLPSRLPSVPILVFKSFSSQTSTVKKGLVLGAYSSGLTGTESDSVDLHLTETARSFNDANGNRLIDQLNWSGAPKKGEARVLYGIDREFPAVAVVNLGPDPQHQPQHYATENQLEECDTARENLRNAVAAGVKALRGIGTHVVSCDPCGDAEAVAESAALTGWLFQDLKDAAKRKPELELICHSNDQTRIDDWTRGLTKAGGQNLARWLTEMPSNHMTPTIFAQNASELLGGHGVDVQVRDREWAAKQGMGAFLAVAQGSLEAPVFLEITYNASAQEKPVTIVGKGVTFDTGGISLKPPANMDKMRGDMGGAACTVAAILSAAKLKLDIHLKGLIPLCENMPSGTAIKPGDVVMALNGKTIQIDNTDAEGRLILADALAYAQRQYQPNFIMDIATLTGAISVALGSSSTGVYTNSNDAWNLLQQSGFATGDRMWRMPLWRHYRKAMESDLADLNNIGKGGGGGSCTAAAFLREFVEAPHWMHLDIAGVSGVVDGSDIPYLAKGMSGRPTRTLIEFLSRFPASNII